MEQYIPNSFRIRSKERIEQSEQDGLERLKELVRRYPSYTPLDDYEKRDIDMISYQCAVTFDLASRAYNMHSKNIVAAVIFLTDY